MSAYSFSRIVPVLALLALASCATPPSQINNVCAVFDQRDGFVGNWRTAAEQTERKLACLCRC
jgi:hypothetical protein